MTETAHLEFLDRERNSLFTVLTKIYFTFADIECFKLCAQNSISEALSKKVCKESSDNTIL